MISSYISYLIIAIYGTSLVLIFIYSLTQLNLLINYVRQRSKNKNKRNPEIAYQDLPYVTIQLPVYNEIYVIKRLLKCISQIKYPNNQLEIQVLDDSTDESIEKTRALIEKIKATGKNIQYIRRTNRIDYKAGALREGLEIAKGKFIAIFDADFLPSTNWLLNTIPHFEDKDIGVVQTRWGHLNRNYSTLTRVQAFALDNHFTLEQSGRNAKGHFINFNGTAGLWRKTCILDAGNWHGDTLTEDLDLSYRAQLKGWKFKYLEDVETMSELPIVISAFRSQQFRWNKGGAENFKKNCLKTIQSKNISFKTKVHSVIHLLSSSMFLCVFTLALFSVPMLYIKNQFPHLLWVFNLANFFVLSATILFICYWFTFKNIQGGGFEKFIEYIRLFFTFLTVVLGFSLHNTLAVLEGYSGKKSEFIRTPKFNLNKIKSWKNNKYVKRKMSSNVFIEILLLIYFIFGLYSGIQLNDYGLFPFHLMLLIGYLYVLTKSIFTKT